MRVTPRPLQFGMSMIEILVTLTIVAFAVLGLLGLQARALGFQKDSFDRKAVAEMVDQLAERMRANHLGYMGGSYARELAPADATPAAPNDCAPNCSVTDVATRDLDQWLIELRRRLPTAAAYIVSPGVNATWNTVTVAWREPQQTDQGPLRTGDDAVCDALGLPADYRCYQTRVFP